MKTSIDSAYSKTWDFLFKQLPESKRELVENSPLGETSSNLAAQAEELKHFHECALLGLELARRIKRRPVDISLENWLRQNITLTAAIENRARQALGFE